MEDQWPAIHCAFDEMRPTGSLVPHPMNPNTHPRKQIEMLAEIIRFQGWRAPIAVSSRSGFIVRGHGRLLAAQHLGCENVPVDVQDYDSEAAEYADLIADNRIAELAEIDESQLEKTLRAIGEMGMDLGVAGFDIDALANLGIDEVGVSIVNTPEEAVDDSPTRAEELCKQWHTKTGQLWELGGHRLLCGDSTNEKDYSRLMGGDLASLLVTDPPYGVSYASKNEFLNAISRGNRIQVPIAGDHEKPEDMAIFWVAAFAAARVVCAPGASYYITGPQGGDLLLLLQSLRQANFPLRHMLIWAKNNHVLGRCDYHYKHEPIVFGWVEGTHKFFGGHSETSLWEIDKPHKSEFHPTQKPIELFARCMRNSSARGDVFLDPFSGSGTTILAAEELGRRARAIEIDPGYVAVALERWATLTGKAPQLI